MLPWLVAHRDLAATNTVTVLGSVLFAVPCLLVTTRTCAPPTRS